MGGAGTDIIVYSPLTSARLNYIVKLLFSERAMITNDTAAFESFPGKKINYSKEALLGVDSTVVPHSLLFEQALQEQQITVSTWHGLPVFFETIEGSIPFDIFAASFYLITRYEEWLPNEKDYLGRYQHEQSLAYQHGFLDQPLVNVWMEKWVVQNNLPHTKPAFSFRPSYDIDIAYSYIHHSILRNVGGYFKDLLNASFSKLTERMQVLAGLRKDPYDVYDWLDQLHEQYKLDPIYFFLVAAQRDAIHKNISPNSKGMGNLIQVIARKYKVGLHPSVQKTPVVKEENDLLNSQYLPVLQNEKLTIEKLIAKSITKSRQHYIQLNLPTTYEALLQAGITEDYSMGYPGFSGFRSSYTGPFNWFHLLKNEETSLKIFPFCYMDATQIFHERNTPEVASTKIEYYYQQFRQYGGCFIPIFHNQYLSEQSDFAAWQKVYADFCLRRL
ncbi:MAG: hypothetical protein RI983_2163 [Bacteroidota bacterium]